MESLAPSHLIPRSAAHREDAGPWTDSGWARWNRSVERYTLGIEEEVALLEPSNLMLAQHADSVMSTLPHELAGRMSAGNHAGVLEFTSAVHASVAGVTEELSVIRSALARELGQLGLAAAAAGTHPAATWIGNKPSRGRRNRDLADSLRGTAEAPPTMALHVHVGIPDPEDAVRVMNAYRRLTPLLLALAANSPLFNGRDRGLASERTFLLERLPRSGAPRRFTSYADYVRSIDPLIRSGAFPHPSYLWWDVRLQPELGTVEFRAGDSQTSVADTAGLAALLQSIARLVVEARDLQPDPAPEVLEENRFLAARDGVHALLVDECKRKRAPAKDEIFKLLETCRVHASALGCERELKQVARLVWANGADRQRAWFASGGTREVLRRLSSSFAASAPAAP